MTLLSVSCQQMPGITKLATKYANEGLNVLLFPTEQVNRVSRNRVFNVVRCSSVTVLRLVKMCFVTVGSECRKEGYVSTQSVGRKVTCPHRGSASCQ